MADPRGLDRLLTRVGEQARKVTPAKVAKTLVALPFYVIGIVAGATWFVIAWAYSAVVVGFSDGARRRKTE